MLSVVLAVICLLVAGATAIQSIRWTNRHVAEVHRLLAEAEENTAYWRNQTLEALQLAREYQRKWVEATGDSDRRKW